MKSAITSFQNQVFSRGSPASTSDEKFFQEQQLPVSILDDYKSAAEETQYEISENTKRVYSSSFSIFQSYCEQHGLSHLPADPRSIISFIGHQKELYQEKNGHQLSKQTINTRLAAIRFFHIQAGYHSPTEHPLVVRVMRGLMRNQYRQISDYDQQPITYDELEMLLLVIDQQPQQLTRLRDKAILQLGMQGGFRRSELAEVKVEHLSFLRDKLKVRLPYSKSNQQGQREWKDLPKDETFSAYEIVKQWIDTTGITQGHLFRSLSRDGNNLRDYQLLKPKVGKGFLRGDDIYQMIKKYCDKAGLNSKFYGAHSLRSGCVTQLHENDKDHLYIMGRTGHTDPRSLRHYLKPKD
ncbi:tyrosine-type recombinase/integrase [Shewanella sp. 10N.261.52.F9]|uniref:tyrosine-type recombinase/integrase n=1 Tax=Shewanella TaxID=22 RepID=UPI0020105818|nr:tyrosine-type recombinase/integrase [Shewanella marinintestina]MCL1144431.1 tyrosine-type recombinase/integrase [Shewanella marinintestina]